MPENTQNALSESEKTIISALRSLKPMETVIIRADSQGKLDKFYIKRTEAFFIVAGDKHSVADKLGLKDL